MQPLGEKVCPPVCYRQNTKYTANMNNISKQQLQLLKQAAHGCGTQLIQTAGKLSRGGDCLAIGKY